MKKDLFRDISVKLLFPIFMRSGLSANQITGLNFLLLGVPSLILFFQGREWLGLGTAILMAMIDYVDGTVARARGGNTTKGAYLDTSLDWLYLMLLLGAVSFRHNCLATGFLALVAIVFGNWVEFNGFVKFKMPFILGIKFLLVSGIVFSRLDISILLIAITQGLRTGGMYLWSILTNN